MSFKIDLGLNEKRGNAGNIDLVTATEDMARAESALTTCETERAIVIAAAENLERGMELSKAIADKTQDEGVALAVGKEALTASLRMLGQASAASQLTAGTESFTAGAEASEGMLKKLIEKAKEYTKKVWDYIRNLVAKVVKYVKGLFGKGDDTATQLEDLLKKAKDDKRTNLKATEFDKATAKRLINNVKILAKKQGDKGINDSALMDEVAAVGALLGKDGGLDILNNTADRLSRSYKNNIISASENDSMDTVKNKIQGALTDKAVLKGSLFNTSASIKYSDEAEKYKDLIEEKLDSDMERAYIRLLANDSDTLTVLVIDITADDDVIKDFNGDTKTGKEAFEVAKKVVDSIKVKTISVTAPTSEIEEYAEKLEPIPYNSAENIVKKLKDATKTADKTANKIEKDVEKAAKSANKALDEIEKTDPVKNNTLGVEAKAAETYRAVINMQNELAKAMSKAIAANIKDAARPKWGDIIKESVRLYEK